MYCNFSLSCPLPAAHYYYVYSTWIEIRKFRIHCWNEIQICVSILLIKVFNGEKKIIRPVDIGTNNFINLFQENTVLPIMKSFVTRTKMVQRCLSPLEKTSFKNFSFSFFFLLSFTNSIVFNSKIEVPNQNKSGIFNYKISLLSSLLSFQIIVKLAIQESGANVHCSSLKPGLCRYIIYVL